MLTRRCRRIRSRHRSSNRLIVDLAGTTWMNIIAARSYATMSYNAKLVHSIHGVVRMHWPSMKSMTSVSFHWSLKYASAAVSMI